MTWQAKFGEPIALPDGQVLRALRDAGHYVTGLPNWKHDQPEWRLAAAILLLAAEDGAPVMFRRDRDVPRAECPRQAGAA
jgi:hypothetical protein